MPNGDSPAKKISRVRTFQDDARTLNPGAATAKQAEPTPATSSPKPEPAGQTIFRPAATTVPKAPVPPKPIAATINKIPETEISKESLSAISNNNAPVSVIDDDTSAEGSIVTDRKRTSFNLLSSMKEAVEDWFIDEKESFQEKIDAKQKAIPKVRTVENRKEIVAKAAQQSAMAPKDDHQQLAAKFSVPKPKKENRDIAPVQIKKKTEPEKPSWSHFEGAEKEIPPPQEPVEMKASVVKTVIPEVRTVLAPPTPVEKVPPISEKPPEPEPIPAKEPQPPVPKPEVKPPALKFVGKKEAPNRIRFGKFFMYSGVAMIVVLATAGGVTAVWWLATAIDQPSQIAQTSDTTMPVVQPELVNYDERVTASLPLGKEALWQNIRSSSGRPGTDVLLVSLTLSDNTPAGTSDILATINWQANAPFLRNIEKINFGKYRGEPFIVLRTINFDTAFGGILSAEATLLEDLSLFVDGATSTPSGRFTDELIQNNDARILKNETGVEVLIYSFINSNTILITADRTTFSGVASRIR